MKASYSMLACRDGFRKFWRKGICAMVNYVVLFVLEGQPGLFNWWWCSNGFLCCLRRGVTGDGIGRSIRRGRRWKAKRGTKGEEGITNMVMRS